LLHEKLYDAVALAAPHEPLDLALEGVHDISELVFFVKHNFSLLVEVTIINLEKLLNFILMASETVINMGPLGQINMFQLIKVILNLMRNIGDADIVMALMLLCAEAAEELI
jgi:hypothetical protein